MSLTTKYRPLTLDQVIGQGPVISSLAEVVSKRRAKAFLFVGPSGVGKTTLSRIIARMLCDGKATEANIEEIPAADLSGVDDMRSIVNRSVYRAVGGSPVKCIILDECHRLSHSAMQMLLKPIEEPPPHVYWFLCTTELGKIPKTIQTRCLRYDLKAVDDVLIYELLIDITKKEGLNVNESIVEAVAENAGGSVRQAIQYLELVQTCKDVNEARAAINTASGSREAIEIAKWLVKGENLTWQEGMQRVTALENPDPESIRITLVRYISAVAVKSKGQRTGYYLHLLSCFSEPFNPSDGIAGLLVAIGLALGIDRQ